MRILLNETSPIDLLQRRGESDSIRCDLKNSAKLFSSSLISLSLYHCYSLFVSGEKSFSLDFRFLTWKFCSLPSFHLHIRLKIDLTLLVCSRIYRRWVPVFMHFPRWALRKFVPFYLPLSRVGALFICEILFSGK